LKYLFFRGLNLIGATQGTRAGLEKLIKRWASNNRYSLSFRRYGNGSHKNDGITIIRKADYHSTKVMIQYNENKLFNGSSFPLYFLGILAEKAWLQHNH
jgi:hypothetical protein